MSNEAQSASRAELLDLNGRREAILVALAAAEVCWAAPVVQILMQPTVSHQSLFLWLTMLILLLGFFYVYRLLVRARLSMLLQQSILVLVLIVSIAATFRFHIYVNAGLVGVEWVVEPFRDLADMSTVIPVGFVAILTLVYLWARGIHLARRSLSADSVGLSFRSGVLLLVFFGWGIGLSSGEDISGFIVPFFFFALVAVALARIEDVSREPNSGAVPASGYWLGSTVGAVALLVALGTLVALVFHGGGLEQALRWLSPLLIVLEVVLVGLALLILGLLQLIVLVLPFDWEAIRLRIQSMMAEIFELSEPLAPLPEVQEPAVAPIIGTLRAWSLIAILVFLILSIVLFTWWRIRRRQRREALESRESLFSAGSLARNLLAAFQSGRDRIGQMVGLVDRFGLGSRFLSAVTIQRIYVNLVRLATRAGYPRLQTQTPYEYQELLYEALPGRESDVAVITEAYVNAHYGQVPDSREELERIRQCWARVQSQGIKNAGRT
jgi:hypothetical protein